MNEIDVGILPTNMESVSAKGRAAPRRWREPGSGSRNAARQSA
jgi:hypothetical protein